MYVPLAFIWSRTAQPVACTVKCREKSFAGFSNGKSTKENVYLARTEEQLKRRVLTVQYLTRWAQIHRCNGYGGRLARL